MKGAIVAAAGQAPAFADFAEPEARDDEHRVTVTAAALSPLTRARASGAHYSADNRFPFVAGVDGVGRLDDGRRVYFMLPRAPFGAMAERSVVAAGQCVFLPDELDDAAAAAIANPGLASWAALTERARIAPGETVLINGATGAAGRLAVGIARHLGAGKIIATGRNAAALAQAGADVTIALGQEGDALRDAFRAQFASCINIVLDFLWGPSARHLLLAAASHGAAEAPVRFVQIGSAGGAEIALPAAILRSAPIELLGSGLGSVALPRVIAAIAGVMQAAHGAHLASPHRTVALSDVTSAWGERDDGRRIVFTTGA